MPDTHQNCNDNPDFARRVADQTRLCQESLSPLVARTDLVREAGDMNSEPVEASESDISNPYFGTEWASKVTKQSLLSQKSLGPLVAPPDFIE